MATDIAIKPIRTEEDYRHALDSLRELFNAQKGTLEFDQAEILGLLIENYENEHYPIEAPDPIEAIKYLMEEEGLNQSDLGEIIGDKSKASLILNRKRKLSLSMIRKLQERFKLPAEVLIQDYPLAK
ncbi:helix-turn-helix domain-containing protein [Marinoscillum sp.]|uniref:helix-turn-helix domain-containing protein n=1 Tax=Marinoscillum sp. TaxID=2024838 RepID=UPI003BAA938E